MGLSGSRESGQAKSKMQRVSSVVRRHRVNELKILRMGWIELMERRKKVMKL